jgi:IS30 family transposase
VDDRRWIWRLAAAGVPARQIAVAVDRQYSVVRLVLEPLGGVVRKELVIDRPRRGLSLEDRIEIALGLRQGESFAAIGTRVGRHRVSIWREVRRNGGRGRYRPVLAQRQAESLALRPKTTKLAAHPALAARVQADLQNWWSPQQISHRLRAEFGDDASMTISPETIYQSLFVQGRGELRRELTRCLRTGRAARRPRGRAETRGRIPGMVSISERPAEAADRAVPGHWEGDLILGAGGRSAIGTLVERTTRFVMLLHLGPDHSAEAVCRAMTDKILTLPEHLRRSLTWDQGRELARHAQFSLATGCPVYFCEPHSPWQRGSNENTNGLLRQYFPKGTNLSVHTEADLDAAAASLNSRPRMTLDWATPAEKLNQLLLR